jgi:hypothetical protein
MRLDARNRGRGAVEIDVMMRWPPTYNEERHESLIVRDDSLRRAAGAMQKLLGLKEGHRFIQPGRPATWQPLRT